MADRLFKRGDIWFCSFYDRAGVRQRRSTRCRDKRAAEAKLRDFERGAVGIPLDQPAPATPLKEAVRSFLAGGTRKLSPATVEMYTQKCGHLVRLMGDVAIERLTMADVETFIETREGDEEGAASHTVHKELVALRKVLRHAGRTNPATPQPGAVVPRFKAGYIPRDRYLTEAEFLTLLSALAEERRRDFVRVACYTGARLSELQALSWRHVDLTAGWMRIPGTKTERAWRKVPIAAPLRRHLEEVDRGKRTGPILQAWEHVGRDLARACRRVSMAVHRATCEARGWHKECAFEPSMPAVTPNDFRRTFASWMLQNSVEPLRVAKLLGHGSLAMVLRVYGILNDANLVDAVAALPDPERDTDGTATAVKLASNDVPDAVAILATA